jgi:hypothetical protein
MVRTFTTLRVLSDMVMTLCKVGHRLDRRRRRLCDRPRIQRRGTRARDNPAAVRTGSEQRGRNQTDQTPAGAANGGPISGVIPITMGGNVALFDEGFDAAVCP